MPHRLDARAPGFEAAFEAFLAVQRGTEADVARVVDGILASLRARGDAALIEYTERFDRIRLTPETLRISEGEIAEAAARRPA
ncbi:MAG: histidinol dehydrogenase, partial [Proteobacteria bacterium]|nr:histidinol dehydrogenase [Pseudomonadota bacterium]